MSDLDAALARLRAAETSYLALVTGGRDCPDHWPADPPGPDYLGTPCQLVAPHPGKRHRHRIAGSQVTVEW